MKPTATQLRFEAIEERLTRLETMFSRLNATVLTMVARRKESEQMPNVSQKEEQGQRWDLLLKGNHG